MVSPQVEHLTIAVGWSVFLPADEAPNPPPQTAVTQLIARARAGDGDAAGELLPLVYSELRGLAGAVFQGQPENHTLQPTALLHEAWMKLAGHVGDLNDQRHFFRVAAQAMRQVLTDHARGQKREKRGGGNHRMTLDNGLSDNGSAVLDVLAFDEALNRLARLNERHASVVEMRVLGGMTIVEIAETLDASRSTIAADWAMAKAWLKVQLSSFDDV